MGLPERGPREAPSFERKESFSFKALGALKVSFPSFPSFERIRLFSFKASRALKDPFPSFPSFERIRLFSFKAQEAAVNPTDFHAPDAGKVIQAPGGYAAFVPAPLPPRLAYDPGLV